MCLTLVAGVAPAQETEQEIIEIDSQKFLRVIIDGQNVLIPEDQLEQFHKNEEWKREREESDRKLQEDERRQREQEELYRQVFDEINIAEAEIEQLGINLTGIMDSYNQTLEDNEEFLCLQNMTRDNYVEYAGIAFDLIFQPLVSDFRAEVANFFGEDQHIQLATRLYQVMELGGGLDMLGIPEGGGAETELFKLFLLADVIGFTDDQLDELTGLQKEFFTELVGIETMAEEEYKHLWDEYNLFNSQYLEAETLEERLSLQDQRENVGKQIKKAREENAKNVDELSRKAFTKTRTKLDTLLTAEQKAKLSKIKADIPEYMRSALAGMKTGGTNDNAEEASGPWRPGANSWVPGMGAPTNLKNDNREAPRIHEPRDGRRFPGSE